MTTLNRFQLYSQQENTITNNVLLMFSELYRLSPKYFEELINSLFESNELYKVIPDFLQQISNKGNGIIDGYISNPSSKIIIETKVNSLEGIDKLLKYTDSFRGVDLKILIHLSQVKFDKLAVSEIETRLKNFEEGVNINFKSISYEDLVIQLNELSKLYSYDESLGSLFVDFENYCHQSALMPIHKDILRAMACGQSFDLNVKYQFYFDLATRGYSDFKYLGIYKNKAVQFIGLVENNIVADFEYETGLDIKWSEHDVTQEQKKRLEEAIHESMESDWYINKNHRFFLLKDFTPTNFEKTSPGGIFRVRFFDLADYLGEKLPDDIKEIAKALENKTWE